MSKLTILDILMIIHKKLPHIGGIFNFLINMINVLFHYFLLIHAEGGEVEAGSGSRPPSSGRFMFGIYESEEPGNYGSGEVDDFLYWSRPLTEDEIYASNIGSVFG